MKFTTDTQRGDWSDIGTHAGPFAANVFSLWLEHGTHPTDATYAYTVFPAATPDQTARLAAKPEMQIIANSGRQQAVYHDRLKMLGVAFYEAGKVEFAGGRAIEVDRPCALMIRDGRVWVSNPANEAMTVKMRLDGKDLVVELPGGDQAGSSVEVK